ncbi:MAG: quinone-dependent dihydroorotate dehydrogenase [Planctomycetota bacterium]
MNLYRSILRPLLFRLSAETAHRMVNGICAFPAIDRLNAIVHRGIDDPTLRVQLGHLELPNPVGLAAGWDKNAHCMRTLETLGFGALEIGSVSARASIGNPKPRLFRLPVDKAIVVNYGLPNEGADVIAHRIRVHTPRVPLGVNIVKTNDGPEASATADEIYDDYLQSILRLHEHASYLVLNLSCPNSKGDADFFAAADSLTPLLERMSDLDLRAPVFLKVAPDPSPRAIERWIEEADPHPFVHGFLFNLPGGKPHSLQTLTPRSELERLPGAVSGRPVANLLEECLGEMYRRMPRERFILIGGGGIFTADDAYQRIRHGASFVQLYSALIYEGPGVVRKIIRGLSERLRRDGLDSIRDAVGLHWRSA